MGGGGHSAAMINSLKNNRALLHKKSIKERSKDAYIHLGEKTTKGKRLHHKRATKTEMLRIRKKIFSYKLNERKKMFYTLFIIAFLAIIVFYTIFKYSGI